MGVNGYRLAGSITAVYTMESYYSSRLKCLFNSLLWVEIALPLYFENRPLINRHPPRLLILAGLIFTRISGFRQRIRTRHNPQCPGLFKECTLEVVTQLFSVDGHYCFGQRLAAGKDPVVADKRSQ